MVKIREICEALENWAPLKFQESYDNSGLIVGDKDRVIEKAILCLDSTEDVVQEAIDQNAQMVIAHHPIVFGGLKSFTGANYVERAIIKAIKNDVAIYAIHTNLDNMSHGVNRKIGERLGLENLEILSPKKELEEIGSGMIGEISGGMDVMEFLKKVKSQMEADSLRYTKILKDRVYKVAFCGGSGSFLLNAAKAKGADVFLSSDFKYHQFFDAEEDIVIADIGHFEAEQFTKDLIKEYLSEKFPTFVFRFSEVITNPVNYL